MASCKRWYPGAKLIGFRSNKFFRLCRGYSGKSRLVDHCSLSYKILTNYKKLSASQANRSFTFFFLTTFTILNGWTTSRSRLFTMVSRDSPTFKPRDKLLKKINRCGLFQWNLERYLDRYRYAALHNSHIQIRKYVQNIFEEIFPPSQ